MGMIHNAFREVQLNRYEELGWAAGVLFPVGARIFFLLHSVQIGFSAHPNFYRVGIMLLFLGGEAARSTNLITYLHSSIRLYGMVFTQTQGKLCYYIKTSTSTRLLFLNYQEK